MKARIFRPAKTAMQSGRAGTKDWRLEFDTSAARFVEPLMGWTGTHTTAGQLSLRFSTPEAAIAYATKHGLEYEVEAPHERTLQRRAYSDNFAFNSAVPSSG